MGSAFTKSMMIGALLIIPAAEVAGSNEPRRLHGGSECPAYLMKDCVDFETSEPDTCSEYYMKVNYKSGAIKYFQCETDPWAPYWCMRGEKCTLSLLVFF